MLVATGIWRAAGRYTGARVWAVLARVAVVLGVVFAVMTISRAFGLG